MARPMVVGDRLWLFSQTPSGPAPVQSMMLNNSGGTSSATMRSSFPIAAAAAPPINRLHPPHQNHPIMDGARNALLSRGQPLNYGGGLSSSNPHHHRLPTTPPIHFKPYETFLTNKYQQSGYGGGSYNGGGPMRKPFFFGGSDLENGTNAVVDDHWQMKYGGQFNGTRSTAMEPPNEFVPINGIAELERAFGDRNSMLPNGGGDSKDDHRRKDMMMMLLNNEVAGGGNGGDDVSEAAAASSSDIDCEEIDDED